MAEPAAKRRLLEAEVKDASALPMDMHEAVFSFWSWPQLMAYRNTSRAVKASVDAYLNGLQTQQYCELRMDRGRWCGAQHSVMPQCEKFCLLHLDRWLTEVASSLLQDCAYKSQWYSALIICTPLDEHGQETKEQFEVRVTYATSPFVDAPDEAARPRQPPTVEITYTRLPRVPRADRRDILRWHWFPRDGTADPQWLKVLGDMLRRWLDLAHLDHSLQVRVGVVPCRYADWTAFEEVPVLSAEQRAAVFSAHPELFQLQSVTDTGVYLLKVNGIGKVDPGSWKLALPRDVEAATHGEFGMLRDELVQRLR
jgi:hypothetical protein